MTQKRSKYGAIKTEVDGITFHSRKEAARYQELKFLEAAGEISEIECQPKIEIIINDVHIAWYIADFRYLDNKTEHEVIEDVKSEATKKLPVYRLKKKLVEAIYKIKIEEV